MTAFAVLEDRANRERSQDEVTRAGRMITRAIQIATANALRDGQLADVHRLIDDLSGHEAVFAVRLFDVTGKLGYATPAGRRVPLPAPAALRQAIAAGALSSEPMRIDGQPLIGWLAPLDGPGGRRAGAIQVLQLESFVEQDAAASSRAIAIFAALLIGSIAFMVFAVTRQSVVQPVDALVQGLRGIGIEGSSESVHRRRRDELGRLASEFDDMRRRLARTHARLVAEQSERRRIEADLREAERLASLGRFAAGVAHEIATPLNVITGRAEAVLRRGSADPAAERALRSIVEQGDRISHTVRGVLDFARARELHIEATAIDKVVTDAVDLLAERTQAHEVVVAVEADPRTPLVAADSSQLEHVFLNLIGNAIEAMPAGGRLTIHIGLVERERAELGAGVRTCLAIGFQDQGVGIAPEHLDRVFEPFFTTKEVGGGTGLGLAISYGIVREHGGWIEVASTLGHGSCLTVCLPLQAAGAAEPPVASEVGA